MNDQLEKCYFELAFTELAMDYYSLKERDKELEGGKGFERIFVETTLRVYNYLLDKGYTHEHIKLLYDSDKEHNERAWREYFPSMLLRID